MNGFSYGAQVVLVVISGSAPDDDEAQAATVLVGAWICPSQICDTPVTVLSAFVEAERRARVREMELSVMECIVEVVGRCT